MKLLRNILALVLIGMVTGCGNSMHNAGETPSTPVIPASLAQLGYTQVLYNKDNAKELMETAMSGLDYKDLVVTVDGVNKTVNIGNEVRYRINKSISSDIINSMPGADQTKDMWYEKINPTVEEINAYINSQDGLTALGLTTGTASASISNKTIIKPKIEPITVTAAVIGIVSSAYSLYTDYIHSLDSTNDALIEMNQRLDAIDAQLVLVNQELTNLDKEIDNLTQTIDDMYVIIVGSPFETVYNHITGFTGTIKSLTGDARNNYIEAVIAGDFEDDTITAYNSLVNRHALNKQQLMTSNNYTAEQVYHILPFNMRLKDIFFLQHMSQLRLSLAPSIKSGNELLLFRGNSARMDLERVKMIKKSILARIEYTTPEQGIYLLDTLGFVITWEISLRAHMKAAANINDPSVLESEKTLRLKYASIDLQNTMLGISDNGFGCFGKIYSPVIDLNSVLASNLKLEIYSYLGNILTNSKNIPLLNTGSFAQGDSLAALFDNKDSGALDNGKSLRITVNGTNIQNMGIIPVYKTHDLTTYNSPDSTQCYVDLYDGVFTLPKPIFWSKFDDQASYEKPEIGEVTIPTPNTTANLIFNYGGFNKSVGYSLNSYNSTASTKTSTESKTLPLTAPNKRITKGTLSMNFMIGSSGSASFVENGGTPSNAIYFYSNEGVTQSANNTLALFGTSNDFRLVFTQKQTPYRDGTGQYFAGNATVVTATLYLAGVAQATATITQGGRHYLYILWDEGKSLATGDSFRMYVDGTLKLSTKNSIYAPYGINLAYTGTATTTSNTYSYSDMSTHTVRTFYYSLASHAECAVDNVKIWNRILPEDAAWINALNTKEAALDPVYGPANNYGINDLKVSFYHQ